MRNKGMKYFSFEEIFPFPSEKSINMIPFMLNFEILKFDKYMGEPCPVLHLKEFSMLCPEVSYNEDYLKRIFIRSLEGPTLEWLMNLPRGSITSFNDLTGKFVA